MASPYTLEQLREQTDTLTGELLRIVDGRPLVAAYAAARCVADQLEEMIEAERKKKGNARAVMVNVVR